MAATISNQVAQGRVARLVNQLTTAPVAAQGSEEKKEGGAAVKQSVTLIDNRTGKKYELAVKHGCLDAQDIAKIKIAPRKPGLKVYDPGYTNTASCTSRICFINGSKGVLRYRGYPIEQLAESSTFMEVSYLLMYGQLPDKAQLNYFEQRIMRHTYVHEDLKQMMKSFRYDAHPMGMVISAVSAMSTYHPEANPALVGQNVYNDINVRNKQVHRILGTMPTIAAYAYRHRIGRPYVNPSSSLTYTENFLYMLDKLSNKEYKPHPRLARALDILFILHADHEQNCSTAAMRHLTSGGVDVYTAVAGAMGALYGPRHGGANEAVLRMLQEIGSVDKVPQFIEGVKAKKVRLMGFGHRIYKNYDPRARIIRTIADEVFSILGREPLIEIATALEKVALSDPYFIERKLYPNVDFYSGVIYKAMGFPTDYFPILFSIPRTVGWLAHWSEFLDDPENKIVRPRQVYAGSGKRDYVPMDSRVPSTAKISSDVTAESKRRNASTDAPTIAPPSQ
jgi:citrate synthase